MGNHATTQISVRRCCGVFLCVESSSSCGWAQYDGHLSPQGGTQQLSEKLVEQIGKERVRLGAAVMTICQVTTPSARGWHRDNEHFSTSGASYKFLSFKQDTIRKPRLGSHCVPFGCFALPLPSHLCIVHYGTLKCLSWLKYLDELNQIHSIR